MKWQVPPASKHNLRARAREIDAIVSELKANPQRWALVDEKASGTGLPWRKRGCEVRRHQVSTNPPRFEIYARWPEGSA